MKDEHEISNLDLPIAKVIREKLEDLPTELQAELLEQMTVDELVSERVDVYLRELELAIHSGYDEVGAKEVALAECLAGML